MDKKWWTLLAVCAGTFMLLLDVTIVVVALPEIQASLHAGFGDVEWVVDAYALTLASLLLTAGVLADRYGRRLLFGTGLAIFTAGSLLCGLAQSPGMLIASRGGQAAGGAVMFATSLALLGESFRGKDRGAAFGIWGAVTGAAVSLGPVLGGAITSGISWRGIFLVNVPIGVAAITVTWWRVEESRAPRPGRPDWAGFVLLTGALLGIVYGLIRASETSWSDNGVRGCLAAGGMLAAAFAVAEWRVRRPMFDLRLFRIPAFTGGLLAALAMNGSLFAMFLYLVLYLQDILGYSALETGLRLLVSTGALLIAAAIAGRLSERLPVRWLIGPGLLLTGSGLLLMHGISSASPWTHLIPGLAVAGLGAGLVNPPLASTAIGVVTPERSGMASGANTTFRQIGFAASIAALGSVFASTLQHDLSSALAPVRPLAASAPQIISLIRQGSTSHAITAAPPAYHGLLAAAIRSSFVTGINDLLLVTAIVALAGGTATLILIRARDFTPRPADRTATASDADTPEHAAHRDRSAALGPGAVGTDGVRRGSADPL
jgi:EmrB/QacA subfamily drug resistance transporter